MLRQSACLTTHFVCSVLMYIVIMERLDVEGKAMKYLDVVQQLDYRW